MDEELFGFISDDDHEEESRLQNIQLNALGVSGLIYIQDFLDNNVASSVFHELLPRFSKSRNQFMHFGLPTEDDVLKEVTNRVTWFLESQTHALGDKELSIPFNQFILNYYEPGDGITPHVDLLKFEDTVVILSLGSEVVMDLVRCQGDENGISKNGGANDTTKRSITLQHGSLLILTGDARWKYTHGIEGQLVDVKENGESVHRGTRISVTMRRMKESAWVGSDVDCNNDGHGE